MLSLTILKDFVAIIKASALNEAQKIEMLKLHLDDMRRTRPVIYMMLNNAESMPVILPEQTGWSGSEIPAESLNVCQSLEAYARGLGYQKVATFFSGFCTPVWSNLIPRNQAILEELSPSSGILSFRSPLKARVSAPTASQNSAPVKAQSRAITLSPTLRSSIL